MGNRSSTRSTTSSLAAGSASLAGIFGGRAQGDANACSACGGSIKEPMFSSSGTSHCRRCSSLLPRTSSASLSSSRSRAVPAGQSRRSTRALTSSPSNSLNAARDAKEKDDEEKHALSSGVTLGLWKALPTMVNPTPTSNPAQAQQSSNAHLYLQHVHIIPFVDTLNDELRALATHDFTVCNSILVNEILTPYFKKLLDEANQKDKDKIKDAETPPSSVSGAPASTSNANISANNTAATPVNSALILSGGMRLKVNDIEFKIVCCHPPIGIFHEDTQIHALLRPFSKIAQLSRIQLAATAASLSTGTAHLARQQRHQLINEYVRPYFFSATPPSAPATPPALLKHISEGDAFIVKGVQFLVVKALPPNGFVSEHTELLMESEALPDLKRLHILPILETLPNNFKSSTEMDRLSKYLAPHFLGTNQIVSKNQKIEIDGVKFKVLSCEPDKGVVTAATEIDANGAPLNADDVKRQQEIDDELLARSLQEEEAGGLGIVVRSRRGHGHQPNTPHSGNSNTPSANSGGNRLQLLSLLGAPFPPAASPSTSASSALQSSPSSHMSAAAAAAQPSPSSSAAPAPSPASALSAAGAVRGNRGGPSEDLRARLGDVLRVMPANDPHRQTLERLYQQLSLLPSTGHSAFDRSLLTLLLAAQAQSVMRMDASSSSSPSASSAAAAAAAGNHGATQQELDRFPTYVYRVRTSAEPQKTENTECCRICLCEFENGDVIRTLPCMHRLHRDCGDKWLIGHATCPICKTSIRGNFDL